MSRYVNFDWVKAVLQRPYNQNSLKTAYRIIKKAYDRLFNSSIFINKVTSTSSISNYVYAPNGFNGTLTTIFYKEGYVLNGAGIGTDLDSDIVDGNVEILDKPNVWQPTDYGDGPGFAGLPWNTPLNRSNIWFNSSGDTGPFNFDVEIAADCDKDLLVGVGGDNLYRLTLDGDIIIDNFPAITANSYYDTNIYNYSIDQTLYHQFLFWNVYPITIPKGTHTLGISVLNPDGPGNPGLMGIEIYDDTLTAVKNAVVDPAFIADPAGYDYKLNYYLGLNMLFSSRFIYQSDSLAAGEELIFENNDPYGCIPPTNDPLIIGIQTIANKYANPSPLIKADFDKIIKYLLNLITNCC